MDKSEVRRIVEAHLDHLMLRMGVPHWRIRVAYERLDGDPLPGDRGTAGGPSTAAGQCDRLLNYEKACITLDCEQFESEDEVLEVLRHELFHVVLAPIDMLGSWMEEGTSGADRERAAMVWRHTIETCVRNLERLWYGVHAHPPPPPGGPLEGDRGNREVST